MPESNNSVRSSDPDELPITPESLPPPDIQHWVARRKAQAVRAVQSGLLTLDEAMARYRLSLEEIVSWQRALYRYGVRGLQISHTRLSHLKGRMRRRAPGKGRAHHA